MRKLIALWAVLVCVMVWGCEATNLDQPPTGQPANPQANNPNPPPQPCNGTVVNNIAAVANPNDNSQGFTLEFIDVNNTNANTNDVNAANPGGTVNGGANGGLIAMTSVLNITGQSVININLVNAAGAFQPGGIVPIIPVGTAPPPGNTMFATVVLAEAGAQGQNQWFGAGGNIVLDILVAPTNQVPGQLTATLQGVCFTPNAATGATGTFTINGQYFHNLTFTGP